jgi:hypothetical protein
MNTTISKTDTQDDATDPRSKFKSEYIDQARKLCKLGAIDEEIADFFDVSVRTLHRWKLRHPKLGKAMTAGKRRADERVERALYHRAVGFTFRETKVFQYQGTPVFAEVDTLVIPDVRAAMAWLVNRRGWRMNPQGPALEDLVEPQSITVQVVDGRKRELPEPDG